MYKKYKAKKTEVDGFVFDSKKEANRYLELKQLQEDGKIKDLDLQHTFVLQEPFKKNGKSYRAITYKADFVYLDLTNCKNVVEDVKGFKTDVYQIKKKLFEYKFPDLTIKEV